MNLPLRLAQTLICTALAAVSLHAQQVPVPFVGCKSTGQADNFDAPGGPAQLLQIAPDAAQELAYYRCAVLDFGVLAPRGWQCIGIYSSGGDFLFVSPQSIDSRYPLRGFDGPVIEISERHSGQNGDLLDKVQIMARVFPAYKAHVLEVVNGMGIPTQAYPFGPYPTDRLTYRSKAMVEYRTPGKTEGLGTHSHLKKNGSLIEGLALLNGNPPDLIFLAVRLPGKLERFTPVIIRQVERDIPRR